MHRQDVDNKDYNMGWEKEGTQADLKNVRLSQIRTLPSYGDFTWRVQILEKKKSVIKICIYG